MDVISDKLFFVKRQADAESVATKQDIGLFRSEMKIGFAELRSGNAETRVWTASVGATIIAVLAAIKYFG